MTFKIPNFQEWYFTSTEEGRAVVERAKAEYVAKRQALVDELARLEAAHNEDIKAMLKARQAAEAVLKKAEAAYRTAHAAFQRARVACSSASNVYQGERGRLERELRETAEPEILDFHKRLSAQERQALRDYSGPARRAATEAKLVAIRAARQAAEKLEVSAVENVEMALAEIEAGIPPLN